MKFFLVLTAIVLLFSCSKESNNPDDSKKEKKIGVLLVSHGSRSEAWRKMLLAIEDSVKDAVLSNKNITEIKSAFMEYNGPSIADRMKEFDKDGFTDVVIVPIFLTVSSHSFDDIPTIVGLKNSQSDIEQLKQEKIEVYKTKTNVTITPLLDFPDILGKNLARRVKDISVNPINEACVLVAYGDHTFDKEWTELMKRMMVTIEKETGINKFDYSWCGHIVHYKTEPTTTAIENVLKEKKHAIVMPVLVAYDEMFQGKIIGGAIDKVGNKNNVLYKPDAILPDANLNNWVIDVANKYTAEIVSKD